MNTKELSQRALMSEACRVVVKVGTRVLVDDTGCPQKNRIAALAADIAALQKSGKEVVLVTSGAIGAGIEALRLKTRPKLLPELQMAAAVGQSKLMALYSAAFADFGITVGQVLVNHDDLHNRVRHLNIRNTMMTLLHNGVLPIINENDVVAVDEIRLGDNDVLASLMAILVDAEVLVLLTTVDGLQEFGESGKVQTRIPYRERLSAAEFELVQAHRGGLSVGGMQTKLRALETVSQVGLFGVIADGRSDGVLGRIFQGESVGTLVGARLDDGRDVMSGRKRWIAFFHRVKGAVVVDEGARNAVREHFKSLLPVGVKDVEGEFEAGSLVEVKDQQGNVIAKGLVSYSSAEIREIRGKKNSTEVGAMGDLPRRVYEEVIHRDNMIVIPQ